MSIDFQIERLFNGAPLISPVGEGWESGVTFNSAAVVLDPTPENMPTIQALLGPDAPAHRIVALHYRARPKADPGFRFTRSRIGLSIHQADLTSIRRFRMPVLEPGVEGDLDVWGVEDPRITRVDGVWWMVYCGVRPFPDPDPEKAWRGSICLARSDDLVHWTKCGVTPGLSGSPNASYSNKDGVLFPDRIDGKVMMLHRPMMGDLDTWRTAIASADAPDARFTNLGSVHGPMRRAEYMKSWVGAGAVPIKIGEGRYVSIEHTGNMLKGKRRKYVLDAFLYDFNNWDSSRPESLVAARLDDIMRPETETETKGPYPESVANVVFACGAYVDEGMLYLVYGGGDTFILAARLPFDQLVDALEARAKQNEAFVNA